MSEEIIKVPIEEEAKQSYLDYAMSVIIGRAIPDVRDGLKPVHRRILYGMYEIGLLPNKPYKKSARVVGHILSFYHPHGDQAVYDTLVRMAQPFTMRYPLIDGQGNFGSIDGDPPAALRYTEARLTPIAVEMLEDIEKDTVDWSPNFDGTVLEPKVLPSKFPNLICNGTSGIAVGLATSIPPHNLKEVVSALIALAKNPEITVEELVEKYIKAPDFPTGGIIENSKKEIIEIYKKGKGTIHIKAKIHIEKQMAGKEYIVITELPYQVNKAELIKRIANLVRDKKIKNITDLRDESDKEGIRIVIEVSRFGSAKQIVDQLLKHTQLRKSFPVNMVVLVDGEPKLLGLKDLLIHFIKHRLDVITRRTKYFLQKSQKRHHIIEGLIKAVENIDKVVEIVKSSTDVKEAKKRLMENLELTEQQAQAILDLRLYRLTSMEISSLKKEKEELVKKIEEYKNILKHHKRKIDVFIDEMESLVKKYGDERKTFVEYIQGEFIKSTFQVVIFADGNYEILETLPEKFEKHVIGILKVSAKEGFFVITNKGKTYWITGDKLLKPEKIKLKEGEHLIGVFKREFQRLLIATAKGYIKKLSMEDFNYSRKWFPVIKLTEGDEVVGVCESQDWGEILIYTQKGKILRFPTNKLASVGPTAKGSIGIKLEEKDRVAGISAINEEEYIIVFTEKGKVKKIQKEIIPIRGKGTKGVKINLGRDKLIKLIPTSEDFKAVINWKNNGAQIKTIKLEELPLQKLESSPKTFLEGEISNIFKIL